MGNSFIDPFTGIFTGIGHTIDSIDHVSMPNAGDSKEIEELDRMLSLEDPRS